MRCMYTAFDARPCETCELMQRVHKRRKYRSLLRRDSFNFRDAQTDFGTGLRSASGAFVLLTEKSV